MKHEDNLRHRLRSERSRRRAVKKASDKQLLRLHQEEDAIYKRMTNLEWVPLTPPIQQGFVRLFVVRSDVRRTKQGPFYEKLLGKINTRQWSHRKDFKEKRRRFGKKVYVERAQRLVDVDERKFRSNHFSEAERMCFSEVLVYKQHCRIPVKVYRFIEDWRFVLRVQPNMITRVRIKDVDLEAKAADIDRFFSFDCRRERIIKLLYGYDRWRWKSTPLERIHDPFKNRSFNEVLAEFQEDIYWNKTLMMKPSDDPGVSFFMNSAYNRGFKISRDHGFLNNFFKFQCRFLQHRYNDLVLRGKRGFVEDVDQSHDCREWLTRLM